MILRNTSKYPITEVKALVKFATQEIDMRRVCVNVKGGRVYRGRAYDGVPTISNAPPTSEYLVVLIIPPLDKLNLPIDGQKHMHSRNGNPKNWPAYELNTWQEALIRIAAHEGKHIEQYREGLKRSELKCERFAKYMVERWRAQ